MAAPESVDATAQALFYKALQQVTVRIHEADDIEQIMLDASDDICHLFNADRFTLYVVNSDHTAIVSKVKTGLNSSRDLKLPITPQSIAGYVAFSRKLLNIQDVDDAQALQQIHPALTFLRAVDQRTGYRTRQMLVAPILDGEVLYGVLQVINRRDGRHFGALEVEGMTQLCKTLATAIRHRIEPAQDAALRMVTKYDGLVADGRLTAEELRRGLQEARTQGLTAESVLLSLYPLQAGHIGASLARFFGVAYEPATEGRVRSEGLHGNLKREFLETQGWIPLEESPDGLVVMCLDPEVVRSARIVPQVFPRITRFVYRVTTQADFNTTLAQVYGQTGAGASIGEMLADMDSGPLEDAGNDEALASAAADNELVKLVNKIILDAYHQGASDIHIEPLPGKLKTGIRFRIDGALQPYIEVPAHFRQALVTRLKIMCDLDISERRRPQDGKIKFKKYGPLDIELRVATIPTAGGVEDVVLRILAAGEPIKLDQLGLAPRNHENLIKCVEKPYGLFFVCGPTGSGKTTTLHSVLGYLNRPETKIWTAEDPVEITQKGLRQVQVNKKAGLDFATVMKAFLRADPDIIMVGEMRDPETTGIGIEASLTGHLVFATLHTNSATESIIRLLDMGMDPFNFADALLGILAQRLGKRLCKECKVAYEPSADEIKQLLNEYSDELTNTDAWKKNPQASLEAIHKEWLTRYAKDGKFTLYRAKGCPTCSDSGYKGRVGLHELLVGTDPVKKLIQEKARVAEILACALNEGMRTLKMDGIEKVMQGITDIKQVRAVCIK